MKFKTQKAKIRYLVQTLRDIHSLDNEIYYCDILSALSIILEKHRDYYEQSIKKQLK